VNYPDIYPLFSDLLRITGKSHERASRFSPPIRWLPWRTIYRRPASFQKPENQRGVAHHGQGAAIINGSKGLGKSELTQHLYCCFGLIRDCQTFFNAKIYMIPLESILSAPIHL